MTRTDAKLEVLSTALDAFNRAALGTDGRAICRAESRLEDAAVSCGMDRREGDLQGWAAERVTRWLLAA